MKKFTIFLLIFLLFVGFSHVNAQGDGNLNTVTIEGTHSGCVGDLITLTAVPMGEQTDYTLQWKVNGQFTGESGLTFQFYADEPISITEYTVEMSFGSCGMVFSPVFEFQSLPKAVLLVDDYNICSNGMVEVTANVVTFGAQVYRYVWFDEFYTEIASTFINTCKFYGAGSYYVCAEMLDGACNSDTVPFAIQGIAELASIGLGTPNHTCINTPIYFALEEDENIKVHGNPTITWWVDGAEVPGEGLYYLNFAFNTQGYHYVQVQLLYPSGCELLTSVVSFYIVAPPTKVQITGTSLYCSNSADVTLYPLVVPSNLECSFTWFRDGDIVGTGLAFTDFDVPNREGAYLYTVLASNEGCELLSDNFPVYVNRMSNIGIEADNTTICQGETVKLSANIASAPNMSFQWYANGIGIPFASSPVYYTMPSVTTVYTFTATLDDDECSAESNPVVVTVLGAQQVGVEIIREDTICRGEQVHFMAFGTDIYTWRINGVIVEGAVDGSFTYNFNEAGTFEILVSAAGCSSYGIYVGTITVKASPIVSIEGPVLVCNIYDPSVLYAIVDPWGAPVDYQWFLNNDPILGGNNPTQAITGFYSTAPYIYKVQITDIESGCVVYSGAHTVYVQQLPVIGIHADKLTICPNETVELTADVSPSYSAIYQWYADGLRVSDYDPTIIDNAPVLYIKPGQVFWSSPVTFTFMATQYNTGPDQGLEPVCIATSNEVTISVIPKPDLFIQPIFTTICKGEQVTFTAFYPEIFHNLIFTWYINGTPQGATLHEFTHLFNDPGEWNVMVSATTSEAGCTSDVYFAGTIFVKAPPTVFITGPQTVCISPIPTLLTANVFPLGTEVSYQWYEGTTTPLGNEQTQAIINSLGFHTYMVEVTDLESGCVVYATFDVEVVGYGDIQISTEFQSICAGSPLELFAQIDELGNQGWSFFWIVDGVWLPGFGSAIFYPEAGDHYYMFMANQSSTGCSASSSQLIVEVKPIPDQPVLTISDDKICSGNPVTVTGDVEGDYTWFINGFETLGKLISITDQPTANNVITTYTYNAQVEVNGCSSLISEPVTVDVHPALSVAIYGGNEVCEQPAEGEQLSLYALVEGLQEGVDYQYEWYMLNGNNPAVMYYGDINNYYSVIPYAWMAGEYEIYVVVTAVDYGCTAQADAHHVSIYEKPTVAIQLDNYNICLGGTVTATAYPTPAPIPNHPYIYHWTVNGVPYGFDTDVIEITEGLFYGNNDISVTIERAYSSTSCFGSYSANVHVTTPPSLVLTQDIEGLILPGMCVGGKVNLYSNVVDFDETLIDVNDFNYEWRRDGIPLAWKYDFASEVLNTPGIYNYEVRAYLNNNLGCNTEWTAFDPVKVVAQPTVQIAPKDFNYFDVCQGATVEIINNLGVTDPTIQIGYQFKWNDLQIWENFTNQIDPRTIKFNEVGNHSFYLEVEFANPTCLPVKVSNELVYHVVNNPIWTSATIMPDPYDGLCLGETVTLSAEFTGGVNDGSNIGLIQWMYSFNGDPYVNLTGTGGNKVHKPAQAGVYTYMAVYYPSQAGSGCHVAPNEFAPIEVSTTPTAVFNFTGSGAPHICGNDPYATIELPIVFTGKAPFEFLVKESNGNEFKIKTNDNPYTLVVSPTTTTQYTVYALSDATKCKDESDQDVITVVVTNIEVLTPYVTACTESVDVNVKINSSFAKTATITFAGTTWDTSIKQIGSQSVITIEVPAAANLGEYPVNIQIDGCDYQIVVNVAKASGITAELTSDQGTNSICANDPSSTAVNLYVHFEGTAPFTYLLVGTDGTKREITSFKNNDVIQVSPKSTTTYYIEWLLDGSGCAPIGYTKPEVTVNVTNIEVLTPYVTACTESVDINLKITSTTTNTATITFAGITWVTAIKQNGSQSVITIDIPKDVVKFGEYPVLIQIDGCEYPIVIYVGKASTLSAQFTNDPPTPRICSKDPSAASVSLFVHFEGTPPFNYMLVGTDGTNREITSTTNNDVIQVSPKATTTYYLKWLFDDSGCTPIGYAKPEITVMVTDVEIVTNEIATCDQNIELEFYVISALDQYATVTIGSQTWDYPVKLGYNSISIDISALGYGTFNAKLFIDDCEYKFTVLSNHTVTTEGGGTSPLIHVRWEGYYEVLVVSNNPDGPYGNGGYFFTSYQWYSNGVLIPGATEQYYQDPNGLSGNYSVRLTGYVIGNPDATIEFSTCDANFGTTGTMKVYPVPANIDEPVWVELELTPAELEGAYLDIYDAKGAHVKTLQIVSSLTQIDGFKAQGTYFGRVTTGTNKIKAVKFVIVK
jgi:hypothetical protein